MATTVTLTAVPSLGATKAVKHKVAGHVLTGAEKRPVQQPSGHEAENVHGLTGAPSLSRQTPTFRIPKLERTNPSVPSPDQTSSSLRDATIGQPKPSIPTGRVSHARGKRKLSLSQYQEHKRLKSDESFADTDMRTAIKVRIPPASTTARNSPTAVPMDDDSSSNSLNASPKVEELSKDSTVKSNLSEPGVKKLIKRNVVWADERNQALVHTSLFEIDECERAEMHPYARTGANTMSMAQFEKFLECDLRQQQRLQDHDDRSSQPPLPLLIRIALPTNIQRPAVKSSERFVQEEREKSVLQAFFIHPLIPDTPGEPDKDSLENNTNERIDTKSIPLEDNTATIVPDVVSSVNSNNSSSTLPTSTSSFSLDSLSPEVAQILAQAKGKLTSTNTDQLLSTLAMPTATQTAPSLPPGLTPERLSALLSMVRTPTTEITNVSSANLAGGLPLHFTLPPPPTSNASLNQILLNALSLGLLLPPPPPLPAMNASMHQSSALPFNMSGPNTDGSSRRHQPDAQHPPARFRHNNYRERGNASRGNARHHHHQQRGLNNAHRRGYHSNRNVSS